MMQHALAQGFSTMQHDGIEKVLSGDVSAEELIRTVDMTDRL